MRRILVLTVGGSDAPVVHAIEQNAPSFVYFLCSGGDGPQASAPTVTRKVPIAGRKQTCPRCGEHYQQTSSSGPIAIEADLAEESYRVETVADPDDMDQVTSACERIADDIADRFAGEVLEIIANYTGGTKTMTLGLGLYAHVTEGHWKLQVNASKRPDLIQIRVGDLAVRQLPMRIRIREAQKRATELMERHDYDGARGILEATIHELGPTAAQELGPRATEGALRAAWDRFDYECASDIVRHHPSLGEPFASQLRELLRVLDLARGEQEWHRYGPSGAALVEDLLENAERCAERERFDDAVSRLYRATELVAQLRLRRAYGLSTSAAEAARGRFGAEIDDWLAELRSKGPAIDDERVTLGLMQAWELLARIGDPVGQRLRTVEAKLKGWIGLRNESFLAHGLKPIDKAAWKRLGPAWIEWLREATKDLAADPVSPEQA